MLVLMLMLMLMEEKRREWNRIELRIQQSRPQCMMATATTATGLQGPLKAIESEPASQLASEIFLLQRDRDRDREREREGCASQLLSSWSRFDQFSRFLFSDPFFPSPALVLCLPIASHLASPVSASSSPSPLSLPFDFLSQI